MEPSLRYTVPTRYDAAPFGTVCIVRQEEQPDQLYVQLADQDEYSDWQPMGYLLEKVFTQFLTNDAFIHECLRHYITQDQNFLAIGTILALKK